jgi:histidinol-phosphate aminotransferase
MDLTTLAPDYVRSIAPYIPGKPTSEVARELGLNEADIVKLASNENPLGCGERAKAAMVQALEGIHIYPDGSCHALRSALAQHTGHPIEGIVIGNGSNDMLEYLAMAFLSRETSAVFSQHCFAVYPLATMARGAMSVKVPAKNFGIDLDAMLAAVRADTRLLFLANPNNPTGTFLEFGAIHAFLKKVPQHVIVVLDQAYNEFLPKEVRVDTDPWLREFPNLVLTRTFAKIHGLAGLRTGYLLAHPQVADMVNRVRAPFNVNSVGQAAAVAALGDAEFVERTYQNNRAGMAQLEAGFQKLGLTWIPSYGNFIAVNVAKNGNNGASVFQKMMRHGVIVRPVANYEMPDHLRITIGLPQENEKCLIALEKALA